MTAQQQIPAGLGPMTYEDLMAQTEENCIHELVRGEIIRVSPTKGRHGPVELLLGGAFDRYLYSTAIAKGWTEPQGGRARESLVGCLGGGEQGMHFSLPDDPDQVRGADLLYLTPEQVRRHEAVLDDEYVPEVPALVVEVISPSERAGYVREKVADYLTGGARLVWCLYLKRKRAEVHRADGTRQVLGMGDVLDGEDVLPGFTVSLDYLFG